MSRRRRTYTISRSAELSGLSKPPPRRQSPRFRPPTPPTPHTPILSAIDVDTMARQTITYMNVLAEHAAAMRNYSRTQCAYQRVMDQGRVLPPDTKWPSLDRQGQDNLRCQMEAIIHRSATTPEDHLEIMSAAHTLLLLQQNILSCLPYSESRRIDAKTNELRATRRRQFTQVKGFRGLVPPHPLPPVERPDSTASSCNVTPGLLNSLLSFPPVPSIVGKKFLFFDPSSDVDILYQVHSVEISLSGHRFAVQSEGTRDTAMLDHDELKELLECSSVV
ncbi:hypothetical protein J3R83DRAFT_9060 [Lanmaoa asiatica]|nr:hypothetical protein J3R83DRAFT_9060 [Lanmaoa asiatica]